MGFNVPVSIGGVATNPGDVVIADFSGVLIMPKDEAEADVDWALEKQQSEPSTHKKIFNGSFIGELSGASNYVKQKEN